MGASMGGNSCCFRAEIKDDDDNKGVYVGEENPKDYSSHLNRASKRAGSPSKLNLELQEKDPDEFRRQLKIAIVQT
jgi:hypothetical protein